MGSHREKRENLDGHKSVEDRSAQESHKRKHESKYERESRRKRYEDSSLRHSSERKQDKNSKSESHGRKRSSSSDQKSRERRYRSLSHNRSRERKHRSPSNYKAHERKYRNPSNHKSRERKQRSPSKHRSHERKHRSPSNLKSRERKRRSPSYNESNGRKNRSPSDQELNKRKYKSPCERKSRERKPRIPSNHKSWERENKSPSKQQSTQRRHHSSSAHDFRERTHGYQFKHRHHHGKHEKQSERESRNNSHENRRQVEFHERTNTNTSKCRVNVNEVKMSDAVPSNSSSFSSSMLSQPEANRVSNYHPDLLTSVTIGENALTTNSSKTASHPDKYLLEVLLSSPLFWKSRKVCIFMVECHDYIHEKSDDKTNEFKDTLNSLAPKKAWQRETWKDQIDQHDPHENQQIGSILPANSRRQNSKKKYPATQKKRHFTAVTTYTNKKTTKMKKNKKRSIRVHVKKFTDLQGVMRNNFEHKFSFSDDVKQLLNWFETDGINDWRFKTPLFADYWIIRFPKYLPFTWEQYKNLDDFSSQSLAIAYPHHLKECYTGDLYTACDDFQTNLFKALKYHLQKEGCSEVRFPPEGSDNRVILEFRTLSESLVDVILDKSFYVEINVSDDSVTCEWYDLVDGNYSVTDKRNTPINSVDIENGDDMFRGNIIICKEVRDIEKFANTYFSKLSTGTLCKVIVFTRAHFENMLYLRQFYDGESDSNVSKIFDSIKLHFLETPIPFGNMECKKKNLVAHESPIPPFRETLCLPSPDENCVWDYVRSNLDEDVFTAIKRSTAPNILSMPDLPAKKKNYITRRFYRDNLATFDTINKLVTNGITCVITNADKDCVEYFSKKNHQHFRQITDISKILSHDDLKGCKIFMVNEGEDKCKTVFHSLKISNNFHFQFFRYLCIDKIQLIDGWQSTTESIPNLQNEKVTIDESELFKQIEKSNERRVIITGLPRSGKSQTLINIALMIKTHKPDQYIMFFSKDKFSRLLAIDELTEEAVLTEMTSLLSENNMQKELVESWLLSRKSVLFEIIVDDFSYIEPHYQGKVAQILDMISRNFMSVRLWISTRNSTNILKNGFPALVVDLDLLTEEEAIIGLAKMFAQNPGINGKCKYLKDYATKYCRILINMYPEHDFPMSSKKIKSISDKLKFSTVDLDFQAFISLGVKHPCLYDMVCDVAEIKNREKSIYVLMLEVLKDSLLSLNLHIRAETKLLFFINSLWSRNYKVCEYLMENSVEIGVLHKIQMSNGQMKYGIIHIVLLSLTYALPGEGVPELSQIQTLLRLIVSIDPSLLEQRDSQGRTPLLLLMREADSIVVDCKSLLQFFITDLKADITACDNDNRTVLYFKMRDKQSPSSSQPNEDLFYKRIVDRSTLLDLYISLWEIWYESDLQRDKSKFSNNASLELPFSSIETLGVSKKHEICFYMVRGPEKTDVFIRDNSFE